MTKAIRVHANGGPEALKFENVELPLPGPGDVRVRATAIGVNFIDVYHRTGLYPQPLPFTLGKEGAGVVEAVGPGVTLFAPGDRVASANLSGSYATAFNAPESVLVKVPDAIPDEVAAAMMLKGMTAWYLLHRTFKVKAGDTILCHAAAGGVGLILGQWAKQLGATTIGTAGSPEKVELARAHGYDHVINYRDQDFVAEVKRITDSRLCDVVYDSVGKDTFPGSLDCIRPLGLFACFGQSSGPIPPFNLSILAQKGSLFATRPTLFVYIAKREDLESAAAALFDVVASGAVKVRINQRYALKDAAKAHADLESRKTSGTTVLIP
jgi:NADPH2:quinone reductase